VNGRLRSALVQRGLTVEEVADACAVDPKTASRWLSGRVPHRRHRWTVANLLKVDETYLWPEAGQKTSRFGAAESEIVDIYSNRASVPREVWLGLLRDAVTQIDVLVFSGTFFAQSNPRVALMLKERALAGARVRLCFGDPGGEAVRIRGVEEGIGDTLAAKIRASLTYYRSLVGHPRCEVRLHDTTLYTSMFRYARGAVPVGGRVRGVRRHAHETDSADRCATFGAPAQLRRGGLWACYRGCGISWSRMFSS
jgi:transcriptional regulator with XRE-family HTH domain